MKRQIICRKCKMERLGKEKAYDGEWKITIPGTLTVHCYCDSCNAEMKPGDKAWAESFGLAQHTYFSWETEFLIPESSTTSSK